MIRVSWIALLGALWTSIGWCQAEVAPGKSERDAMRQRIDAVRKERTAELDAQEAACWSKFAVTDCQNKVSLARREMLADLKRQEAHLNDADRQEKGAEQIRSNQEKAAERALQQSGQPEKGSGTTAQDRQSVVDDKIKKHSKPPVPAASRAKAAAMDAQTIAKNREAYAEKQRAAERRRVEREKKIKEKGPGAAPLPAVTP
jgi:hypothetical protein